MNREIKKTIGRRIVPASLRVVSGGPFEAPALPFPPVFRPPDHPRALKLRERYRLLEIAGAGTDFERARRLKSWVRSRWNHGWDNEGQQDALDILARAERGGSFHCAYFAKTLTQCCLAVGLPARLVSVWRRDADFPDRCAYNMGHAVSEVYCRELGKWAMLDADANAFYTFDGVPVGVTDAQRAWHADRGARLRQVLDQPAFVTPDRCPLVSDRYNRAMWREFARHRAVDYYCHAGVQTVQGYASAPKKFRPRWLLYAGAAPPLLAAGYRGLDLDEFRVVEDETSFNWPVNRSFIQARMAGVRPVNRLEIRLRHTMPFFRRFEIQTDDGAYRPLPGARGVIALAPGRTRVRARCVDAFGRPGQAAELVVHLAPAAPALLARRKERYWLK